MSAASSLSLARLLSSLDWKFHGTCVHVSLTYHKEWPNGRMALQAEKASLVAILGRHIEAGIWRLEYQQRGAPHWHGLLWLGNRDQDDFTKWLHKWWHGFSGNPSHFAAKVTSGDQSLGTWYLAMHAAKRQQAPPFAVGRWWGFIQRERLLQAFDIHNVGEITPRERVWWARLYRRCTGCRTRNEQGLSWFLPLKWQCEAHAWIMARVADERVSRAPGANRPSGLRVLLEARTRT